MADSEVEQDQKTEAPTQKRLREVSEKGDVLQSKELTIAFAMLAALAWFLMISHTMFHDLTIMLKMGLTFSHDTITRFDPFTLFKRLIACIILPFSMLFLLISVAAIAAPAILGSLGFRWEALNFKPERLNPFTGFMRIFGLQGLVELGKSLLKTLLIGSLGLWILWQRLPLIIGLGRHDLKAAVSELGNIFLLLVLVMSLALAAVAVIDVPIQIIRRNRRLRMSKQEIKDENKQTEGSPEIKAAIRQRQIAVFRASNRKAVQESTVVIANPTHFAVALRYKTGEDIAPIVMARGADELALALREMAEESKVPILHYPLLARALYFTSKSGELIREELYKAVASILAFIFRLNAGEPGLVPPVVDIPEEVRFNEEGQPEKRPKTEPDKKEKL
ncbi:MAG: flagellar type III secretion system protein FlhB [Zymomonas mobilis subsp. pomaceae]|uniref:Type III secretion exporter n=1 Tax=Zymomonas mobilis subsp. pomaceae (strain ATCC 29192 / DSM 22645 / JCM 10191 / CCUG 17912 / NBRC 13757 / NCIMB 11200 / NRRL B-4491 / Barker I) TaxID=579138 RepID=F8ERM4_ZYMMT|nr:flagellar type III secretion system protein FlhB [Zymomonas mobilis]AEI37482.1 type III secretion exporter [Zymomonas mobilis subsp. pomaceae ATCC 29192]MDX5948850.1 flagellar type III secretion system protein FlhB [Zymomonas mobilis subsp. pomaceae]GEB88657.1 flagellar biosynthesis protein FlhB [Zymomonas mobilis subsp. pomaceae]